MTRVLLLVLLAARLCSAQKANDSGPEPTFDPNPWLEDFHQVLSEMSTHYANLEWAVEDRRMDLPHLRQDTEAQLRAATDETSARRTLEKFLATFGDGHLEIQWPKPSSPKPAPSTHQTLCDRMGYNAPVHPGLNFLDVRDYSYLNTPEGKFFPGGLLGLQNHTVLDIIRIGLFSEHGYPEICEQAARDRHIADDADCDQKCEVQFDLAAANLLTEALVRRAEALRQAGASMLVIDITHNGGGSDWVEAVPRALSSVPLRDSRMAFIKHEHWTKQLQDRLREVQTDIKNRADAPILLKAAATKLEKAIAESKQRCDLSPVWHTGKLSCSLLVKDLLFTSGDVLPYAKPGSLSSLESGTTLFYPSRYAYTENPKALPLYVVLDRDTWSAAEYFAAMLQDNHAAAIIGEVTGGAGCGYTNGGIPVTLKNSGALVKMPDCVRFRADGSNEVSGITPDILLPWAAHDSESQRMKKLLAALETHASSTAKVRQH
jgi:hypothetical protein